jgi:hypothetical protein
MTLSVTHPYVSAVTDDNDPNEVGPNEWNAAHSISGTLDAAQFPALTGDVTTSAGSVATTIADDAVTYAKLQNIAATSVVGRAAATLGDGHAITASAPGQLLRVNTSDSLVQWGTAETAGIGDNQVTFAKIQDVATDTLLGRDTAGSGDIESITLNATLEMSGAGVLQRAALTGDCTATAGSNATTLATVNGNVGTFGLVTAASNVTVTPAVGSITGFGTGVSDFLATPSSANLATAVTGETGSGALVFGTSPSITTDIRPASDAGATNGTSSLRWSTTFTNAITADGTAARSWSLGRATSGAGVNLTTQAGGAQSGATDTAGGNLILSAGIATGSGGTLGGNGHVAIFAPRQGATTGSADVTPAEGARVFIDSAGYGYLSFRGSSSSGSNYAILGAPGDDFTYFNGTSGINLRVANATVMQVSAGLVTLSSGQLAFPASQNASADANTLDDYEEGTWTPVFSFMTAGNLSVTYTTQSADYTKIGREVRVTGQTNLATFTHTTASGQAIMTGLPFAAAATSHSTVGSTAWTGVTKANYTQVGAFIQSGATQMQFYGFGSGQAISAISATDMPTGGTPNFASTCSYHV